MDDEDDDKIDNEIRKMERQKKTFKRLLFLNTARMLQVLKYPSNDGDRKRLVHSLRLEKQGMGKYGPEISLNSTGEIEGKVVGAGSAMHRGVLKNIDDFEGRVFEMG